MRKDQEYEEALVKMRRRVALGFWVRCPATKTVLPHSDRQLYKSSLKNKKKNKKKSLENKPCLCKIQTGQTNICRNKMTEKWISYA